MSEKIYRIKEISEKDGFFLVKDEFKLIGKRVIPLEKVDEEDWYSGGVLPHDSQSILYFYKVKLEEVT